MKFISCTFLIILCTSCASNKLKKEFSGNWYSCGKDGTYYELLIKDNLFKYSTSEGLITEPYLFNIIGDTLIYTNPYDSMRIGKALIKFTNDEMIFDYITTNERWIFHRIQEKVYNIENNDSLSIETLKRGKKISCLDKRTVKEKQQDSLIKSFKPIDFQF